MMPQRQVAPMPQAPQAAPPEGRQAYPSSGDIPNMMPEMQAGSDMVADKVNPIVQALGTLQEFVASQEQKGAPQASALKEHLLQFVQAITGAAQEGQQMPQDGMQAQGPDGMAFDPFQAPPDVQTKQKQGAIPLI